MNTGQNVAAAPLRERVGVSIHAIAGIDPKAFVDVIVEAEEAGVRQLWATQGAVSPDLLTIYAAAIARTSSIRLGTSIVPVYPRHPLALAQQAATANAFSPGRLRLGVGTSHRPSIEGTYGLKMESPLSYLEEYVEVLRAMLQQGSADHEGRFFTAHAKMQGAPANVPVLVAALGANSFRRAGAMSDGAISWNVPASHLIDVCLPALREGAREAGRPAPPLVAHVPVVLSTDPEAARAAARKGVSVYARLPFYTNMWAAAGFPLNPDGTASDDLIDALVVMGDEAAIDARIRQMLDAGLDELLLTVLPAADPAAERSRLIRFVGSL